MEIDILDSFTPSQMHDPYTAIDMLVKVTDLLHRIKADPQKIDSLVDDLYTLSSFIANINIRDLEIDVDERTLDDLDDELDSYNDEDVVDE
jgi:hypothetical protein